MFHRWSVCICLFIFHHGIAQQLDGATLYWMERMGASEIESSNAPSFLLELEELQRVKVQINTLSSAQLTQLPFFTLEQSLEIIAHRNRYGPLLSIYEMQQISSLSQEDLFHLQPFLRFDFDAVTTPRIEWMCLLKDQRPQTRGVIEKIYRGSSLKIQQHFRYRKRGIDVGFRCEKDAGEKLLNSWQSGIFDYTSLYVDIQRSGTLNRILLGDYHLNLAQGLNLYTGNPLGGRMGLESIKQYATGLSSARSYQENNQLRGCALTLTHSRLSADLFISLTKRDGLVDAGQFKTLSTSGYHRTSNEVAQQAQIRDLQFGSHLKYQSPRLTAGLILHERRFGHVMNTDELQQKFRSTIQNLTTAGAYFDASWTSYNVFGECSFSGTNFPTWNLGMLLNLSRSIDLSFHLRDYRANLYSLQKAAFGRFAHMSGELGYQLGLRFKHKPLQIRIVTDHFRTDRLTNSIKLPQAGFRYFIDMDIRKRGHHIQLRYNHEQRLAHQMLANGAYFQSTARWRIHHSMKLHPQVEWRTRIEMNHTVNTQSSKAMLLYVEYIFKTLRFPLNLSVRIANAEIPTSKNSIYAFSRVLRSQSPLIAYTHSGQFVDALAKYKLRKTLQIGVHWRHKSQWKGQQTWHEELALGGGYDRTIGAQKNTFAIQLTWIRS